MSTHEKYAASRQPALLASEHDNYNPDALTESARIIRKVVGVASADEMAATLQVSHKTLTTWRWRKRGPPFIKIGKKIFYPLRELATWIEGERTKQRAVPRPRRIHGRSHASAFVPSSLELPVGG